MKSEKIHTPTAAQFRGLIAWMRQTLHQKYFYMDNCSTCLAGRIGATFGVGVSDIFGRGKLAVAERLGFDHPWTLERWAKNNPELWGNQDGNMLFGSTGRAFGVHDEFLSFDDVVKHLEGVAERLEAREQ